MNAWLKKDFRCRIEFASAPHTLPITLSQWLFHIMTRLGLRDTIKIIWAPPALSLWPDLPVFVYKLWITWKYGCSWWPIFLPYCLIHVVMFSLISNLVSDYIQKRRGEPDLFSFEYNLLPKFISKQKWLHGPGIWVYRISANSFIPWIVSPLNSFHGNYSIYEVKNCHNAETIWKFPHFPLLRQTRC